MNYIIIHGRIPSLSAVEIETVAESLRCKVSNQTATFTEVSCINQQVAELLYRRLGGSLRLLQKVNDFKDIIDCSTTKKINIGISIIGNSLHNQKKSILQEVSHHLRKYAKACGLKIRFIYPKRDKHILNYGSVVHNKLLSPPNREIFVLASRVKDLFIARSVAIQNVKQFAFRDRDKPFVDVKMGVLPHKLARIMVNLAGLQQNELIWDPFCGSGNIALEALDMGFSVACSDISKQMVTGTQQNVDWFCSETKRKCKYEIFKCNVTNIYDISKNIDTISKVKAIVTEPFMGKEQRSIMSKENAVSLQRDYIRLVRSLVRNLRKVNILHQGFKFVLISPDYKTHDGFVSLDLRDIFDDRFEIIENDLKWSRANSIIRRRISIIEYK